MYHGDGYCGQRKWIPENVSEVHGWTGRVAAGVQRGVGLHGEGVVVGVVVRCRSERAV
jgi:hypothetical protein